MLESMVSGSNFCSLNWGSTTRLLGNANPSSPDVSLASASLTLLPTVGEDELCSDHLPILISLQMYVTINPIQHRSSINLKWKTGTDTVERQAEQKTASDQLPKMRKDLACHHLKAASHTSGRYRLNTERFQQRYWKR